MKQTIYIYLPEEGVDAWRPVEAEPLGGNNFRILGTVPDDEVWEFQPGQTVRCETKLLVEGVKPNEQLVAVAVVPVGA